MYRKRYLIAALAILLALPIFAAGSKEGATAAANGPVHVTFWHHTYTVATDWMREQIKAYQKSNPNVTVDIVEYPHGDYEVKLRSAFAAGNPPDIINVLDYLFPEFYANGWLAPVDPSAFGVKDQKGVSDLYVKPCLDGMTFNGKAYGVPEEYNTFVVFMNKKLFAADGLDADALSAQWMKNPITWQQFLDLAKKLTKYDASGHITQIGFNWVWGLDPFWYAQQYWNSLPQYGASAIDDKGNSVINSPESVAAFTETWYRLVKDKIGGPDAATSSPVYAFQDFMNGKQAMCIGGPWAPAAWRDNAPDVYANYVVAPIPQKDPAHPKTFVHTYAAAVSSSSKVASEAWRLMNYIESNSLEMYKVAGYVDGRVSLFNDPQFAKALQGYEVYKQGYANGSFVWRSKTWAQEATAIKNAIEEFMQSGDVQGALDKANASMKKIRGQ
jgi:multiple sugar transport system substrate-binding protein